ncbi:tRNA pseudouridine(38-40) synthase [Gammaproteobacteria bacterium]
MRIALGLSYDGTNFHGWQTQQEGLRTVQVCVEQALSRVANHPVAVVVAGRTDAGVHAVEQMVHFDTFAKRPLRAWVFGTNQYLPQDIAISWSKEVHNSFHARFSAVSRRYRYVIYSSPIRPVLERTRVTWDYRRFNLEAMSVAASSLVGTHDFSSYRAQGCQAKSPIRTLYRLEVTQENDWLGQKITIEAVANAFLQHMVRNLAGVLMTIGAGEKPPEWAREVLEQKDRAKGGVTAPPEGLYLVQVQYPDLDSTEPTY